MRPAISFLIPAYNEEGHLRTTVVETLRVLESQTDNFEIIIIDDGSIDQTGAIAEELAKDNPRIKAVHNGENKGFGLTCRKGIEGASKEYIGWVSADTSWPEEALKEAIGLLGKADIITTYLLNNYQRPFIRRTISTLFTAVMNTVFLLNLRYYNGGCFHKAALIKPLCIKSRGLTFWAEALVRLMKKGYSVSQVGLYNKDRKSGQSKAFKIKNIMGTLEMILILIRDIYFIRPQDRKRLSSTGAAKNS